MLLVPVSECEDREVFVKQRVYVRCLYCQERICPQAVDTSKTVSHGHPKKKNCSRLVRIVRITW